MNTALLEKYNVPGPRYTSYPTVPYWDTRSFELREWRHRLIAGFDHGRQACSIYIHLPYCESLCTYCGCNTRITKNHNVEGRYIDALLKEWKMYLDLFQNTPVIEALHLGGGTPTFFSPENLKRLLSEIFRSSGLAASPELSFEGHPGNTTRDHLKVMAELGFDRVSFGIQDFDSGIQQIINRKQDFEQVLRVVSQARDLGYQSINFDLIYGLPGQTVETVKGTIEKTIQLRPDRIAFYSYAHVPKLKPAQKSYETLLPAQSLKSSLYRVGKQLFKESQYIEIGMDHFALKSDELYQSYASGTLHRNFMGYTSKASKLLVGLGASSIGDAWSAFSQNEKRVEAYIDLVENGNLPIVRGHLHSEVDLILRQKILDLICKYETTLTDHEWGLIRELINHDLLDELSSDQLIALTGNRIRIPEAGKPFVRNICMAFDAHLWQKSEVYANFSQTV